MVPQLNPKLSVEVIMIVCKVLVKKQQRPICFYSVSLEVCCITCKWRS